MKSIIKRPAFMLILLCFLLLTAAWLRHPGSFLSPPARPVRLTAATKVKTPLQRYGRLKVSGASLTDSKGNPVQLKGVSTHGLSWFPQYVNKKAFRTLRDKWGVHVIRLAMYTAEYQGYCTGSAQNQEKLKTLIDQAVHDCRELGLYVIIDWHILSDANPNTYRKQAKEFFQSMAKAYAGYPNVLYEICNEPNGDTSWEEICSYAGVVIKTIRRWDKHAVIITGTPNWSQDVDLAAAAPLKGDNLMYAFHFYASTHTDHYRKKLQAAVDQGLAVFVSEFGICEASGGGTVNRTEADKWMKLLDQNQISCIAWNLSNKEEASAMIRNDCTKTFGWKRSDLSDTGKWVYDWLSEQKNAEPFDI